MREFINTLVLAVECHTGGAAGQSNSLLFIRRCFPMAAAWRWDGVDCPPPTATGSRLHRPRGELCINGLEHWMDQM